MITMLHEVQNNLMQDRLQELFPAHYRNGNILMINADCMEVMKHIKDNEMELSCVDPPYGIGFDKQSLSAAHGVRKDGTRRKDKTWAGRDNAVEKYKRGNWDSSPPPPRIFRGTYAGQ